MTETHIEMSYGSVIFQAIKEEMARDESVILIGEDIAGLNTSNLLGPIDRKRIRSTPISENSFTGMGVGAAMTGLRPVVYHAVASFIYLTCDQIINQASKLHFMTGGQVEVPLVIRFTIHSSSSAAQHSDRPYSMCMNTPGLKILVPSTAPDMKGLLKSAIRDNDPVLIFEYADLFTNKELVSTDPEYLVPIGKADIKKTGSDITIVSIGACLTPVLAAAKVLEQENIFVEVIDPRSLVPLDKKTIFKSLAKTGRLIIVDRAHRTNSAASEIAAIVVNEAFHTLKKPIQLITTPDVHIPFSSALENLIYPTKEKVLSAARKIF